MNPEGETLQLEPTVIVIFGITGDLAQRKLLPALYHLFKDKLLHPSTEIIGLTRKDLAIDDLLATVELCVLEEDNVCDPDVIKAMRGQMRLVQLDPANSADYEGLKTELRHIEEQYGQCFNRLYYLSIPPAVFESVVENLGEHGLNTSCEHGTAAVRLLVEKPFGHDLSSAKDLVASTETYFKEEQIFRIDHYLAKESVQNILTFRRHNPVFTNKWGAEAISAIRVTAFERLGIEGRTSYDQIGALSDLIQSHLLQLLTLVMLEVTDAGDNGALHAAKQRVLSQLSPHNLESAVRGQYEGYRAEVNNLESTTETFARIELSSADPIWQGTRLILETGKALADKKTEIVLTFADKTGATNDLTFRIQPNEGIDLTLTAKKPDFAHQTQKVSMDFSYNGVFDEPSHPDAYERVLVDAANGIGSLFATGDEVIASWQALQPILDYWQQNGEIVTYPQGSDGPGESGGE
jgi:glucose-6-phosphate 1-dehydrogenase